MAGDDAVLKAILAMDDLASPALIGFGRQITEQQAKTIAAVDKMDAAFRHLGLDATRELGGIGKALVDQRTQAATTARGIEDSFSRLTAAIAAKVGTIREQLRLAQQGAAEFGATLGAIELPLGPSRFDLESSLRGLGVGGDAGPTPPPTQRGTDADRGLAALGLAGLAPGPAPLQGAEELRSTFDATKTSLDALGLGLYQTGQAIGETDRAFRSAKPGSADFGRTLGVVSLGARDAARESSAAGKAVLGFGAQLARQALAVAGFGSAIGIAVAGLRDFFAVDQQLARIAVTSDGAAGALGEIRGEIEALASELGRPAPEIARAALLAIKESAGDAEKGLALLRGGARLARATFSETAQGVNALATTLDGLGREVSEETVRPMTDMLATLTHLSEAELPEFTDLISRVLVPARQLGFEFEEIAAAITTLQGAGLPTRQIFTDILGILSGLSAPSNEAREAARLLGIDLSEAHVRAVGFAGILEEIEEQTGGNRDALEQLFGSFGTLTGAIEIVTDRSEQYAQALARTRQAEGEAARSTERSKTVSERASTAWNEFKLTLEAVGGAALGAVDSLGKLTGEGGFSNAAGNLRAIREGLFGGDAEAQAAAPDDLAARFRAAGQQFRDPTAPLDERQVQTAEEQLRAFQRAMAAVRADIEREFGTSSNRIVGIFHVLQQEAAKLAEAPLFADERDVARLDALATELERVAGVQGVALPFQELRAALDGLRSAREGAAPLDTIVDTESALRSHKLRLEAIRGEIDEGAKLRTQITETLRAHEERAEAVRQSGQVSEETYRKEIAAIEAVRQALINRSRTEAGLLGVAEHELFLRALEGEVDETERMRLEVERLAANWRVVAQESAAAGRITTEELAEQEEAIERTAERLREIVEFEAERVRLAQELRDALVANDFGDAFTAQFETLGLDLREGALGAQAANEAFGLMVGGIDSLSQALARNALDSKEWARSLGQDIAALIIKFSLLRAVSGLFAGPSAAQAGAAAATTGANASVTALRSIFGFEKGGLMPGHMLGRAQVPRHIAEELARFALPVKAYDRGGVADSPQIAVFGRHGRTQAEAFVPLGGDRKIPVRIEGAGGGGATTVNLGGFVLNVSSPDPARAGDAVLAQVPEIERRIADGLRAGRNRQLIEAVRETARR